MSAGTITPIRSHTIQDAPEESPPYPLVSVVREAAVRAGRVGDTTWQHASECGWSSEQLTEAFACLGLTLFTAYFVNYAQTPLDLPAQPGAGTPAEAGAASAPDGQE